MASGHLKTPHQQAEHMAAPTSPCDIVQKTLANSEPSTHGTFLPCQRRPAMSGTPPKPVVTGNGVAAMIYEYTAWAVHARWLP